MNFTYYLPGLSKPPTLSQIRELGLEHALSGLGIASGEVRGGPDGGAGLALVANVRPPAIGGDCRYLKEQQTWRREPRGRWWVGFAADRRPTAVDLAREELCTGTAIRLRDGAEWVVPRCVAILPQRSVSVPQSLDLDEGGQWIARPAEEYRHLCSQAWRIWRAAVAGLKGEQAEEISGQEEAAIAAEALAVNYRLSAVEIAALSLWTTAEVAKILRALIDWDEVVAQATSKKNA